MTKTETKYDNELWLKLKKFVKETLNWITLSKGKSNNWKVF